VRSPEPISKSQLLQARLALGLVVGLIVLGVVCYGFATETLHRMWANLVARPGGPMTFRFILQPTMAAIAALRDGIKDARLGRRAYLWAILTGVRGPEGRAGRLWEGIVSTARILILAIIMDVIYQLLVLKTFYPAESAIIAVLLAFVPYLLLRGLFARVARPWVARPASS
jgi:hypothetical protein